MKTYKLILTVMAFALLSFTTTSCGNSKKSEQAKTENSSAAEQQGKEYTSAYICPMHCKGSGSDKPGDCPVCGMAYKKKEDHKSDGHKHDEDDHSGHDHKGDDHSGHNH